MKSIFIVLSFVVASLIARSDGVPYKFLSIKCKDVNKDIFDTETCTVNGTSSKVITTVKKKLTKINVGAANTQSKKFICFNISAGDRWNSQIRSSWISSNFQAKQNRMVLVDGRLCKVQLHDQLHHQYD